MKAEKLETKYADCLIRAAKTELLQISQWPCIRTLAKHGYFTDLSGPSVRLKYWRRRHLYVISEKGIGAAINQAYLQGYAAASCSGFQKNPYNIHGVARDGSNTKKLQIAWDHGFFARDSSAIADGRAT